MKILKDTLNNDRGSTLVIAVLILTAIIMIGLFTTNKTSTELQIAGADLQMKKAFYQADGGTEFGAQFLEDNIACYGFAVSTNEKIGDITVIDPDFYSNLLNNTPTFYLDDNLSTQSRRTGIEVVFENTAFMEGGSIQMASGYEGIGKSSGAGGAEMNYKIVSDRQKNLSSTSKVSIKWRHVIGLEDDCKYN